MSDADSFDLAALGDLVPIPDEHARSLARERWDVLAQPPGALGRLEELSTWLAGVQGACPTRPLERARVVVFAGDHGVAGSGVSAHPSAATHQLVRSILAGDSAVNALAEVAGATIRVLDISVDADLSDLPSDVGSHKVRRGSGDISREPALSRGEAQEAFLAGVAVVDEEVDSGTDLLVAGDVGVGSTTAAATLVAVLTDVEIARLVGRGSGIDDRTWMVKCAAVRDAARRGRGARGDMIDLLAEVGGADIAALSGFLVQAAVRRTPVILDGVVSGAAALVAHRIGYRTRSWWLAGHRSTEPAHAVTLDRLSLEPVVDFGLRLGEGTGALIALPILRAASAAFATMPTVT